MEKEFIPYEQALELKALGFDESCIASYRLNRENQWVFNIIEQNGLNWIAIKNSSLVVSCTAPLYQQAFKWFKEKNFICHITNDLSNNLQDEVYVYVMTKGYGSLIVRSEEYSTYEEAELACLKKLIEIVKNK